MFEDRMRSETLDSNRAGCLPLLIEAAGNQHLPELIRAEQPRLRRSLLEHGAILFRGFAVRGTEDFAAVVDAHSPRRLEYVYRSTPRTAVARGVFTATEYPATQEIPLHNENSYQREWPGHVLFCCLQPAASGGETPLASMRNVTAAIGPSLLERLRTKQVKYVRHYRPSVDIPWQTVFQTSDRRAVSEYCEQHGIDHQWIDAHTLRTEQVCQGVAQHPATKETLFFNQAHLFHFSSVGTAGAAALIEMFGEDQLPRNACFGDGSKFSFDELECIRAGFRRHTITFPWQRGDVLLLDNMLVAHGRRPFAGARTVLAALTDPIRSPTEHHEPTPV